ncbi:hypothetical protein D3C79_790290 [compost metagenome]
MIAAGLAVTALTASAIGLSIGSGAAIGAALDARDACRGTNPNCGTDVVTTGASSTGEIDSPITGVTVPLAVSTPKLPSQVSNTLIKRTPNQSDTLKLLVLILAIFAEAVALPLVALPA